MRREAATSCELRASSNLHPSTTCHPERSEGPEVGDGVRTVRLGRVQGRQDKTGAGCRLLKARGSRLEAGFTLIELVIVISMILVLLSIALPMYNQSIIRARETTLRQNLATLRTVIDQYTLDKQKAPQSLSDLVSAGYLRAIPVDASGSTETWQPVMEEALKAVDASQPGIVDVHSGSNVTASDGTAYSSW